jgi:hypothetical protein
MHFDPSNGTPLLPSVSLSLKRSLTQQATATARKAPRFERTEASASSPSSSTGRRSSLVFSPEFEMPTPSSSDSSQLISNSRSGGGSFSQRATRTKPPSFKAAKSKGSGKRNTKSGATELEGPLHDKDYIIMQYDRKYPGMIPPKPHLVQNPKSSLSNWYQNVEETTPQYECLENVMDGRDIWR